MRKSFLVTQTSFNQMFLFNHYYSLKECIELFDYDKKELLSTEYIELHGVKFRLYNTSKNSDGLTTCVMEILYDEEIHNDLLFVFDYLIALIKPEKYSEKYGPHCFEVFNLPVAHIKTILYLCNTNYGYIVFKDEELDDEVYEEEIATNYKVAYKGDIPVGIWMSHQMTGAIEIREIQLYDHQVVMLKNILGDKYKDQI